MAQIRRAGKFEDEKPDVSAKKGYVPAPSEYRLCDRVGRGGDGVDTQYQKFARSRLLLLGRLE